MGVLGEGPATGDKQTRPGKVGYLGSTSYPISRAFQARSITMSSVSGKALRPSLNYIGRRRRRLEQVGFVPSDPLYKLVSWAYDALHALSVELHYLSMKQGVGKPARDD